MLLIDGVHMGSAETDVQGMFRFEHVPPGQGMVTAYVEGNASESYQINRVFNVADDGTLNADLVMNEGTGTLMGQVTLQGQPVSDMRVKLDALQPSGVKLEYLGNLRNDGTFVFDGVPTGEVLLQLQRDDGDGAYVVYECGLDIADEQVLERDIALTE